MMASVRMQSATPLPVHEVNSGSSENELNKTEFYCTRCHVLCSISDLLYGDHVNHSAIRKKEIITYAPASLLHDAQEFAQDVENNFLKPYILQETEMTQSLHMLLKAQHQTQCAIRELTQQLHEIQKSLYALCQNKLLHECNTSTLQQEYLRGWQDLIDAKTNLENILLSKTENETGETCGSCNQRNNGNVNNGNVIHSTETSEKLSSMNASRQLEHVNYILQSVKETLTRLDNSCDNNNDNSNSLWREWLESMVREETTEIKRWEKEKRSHEEVVQSTETNNSFAELPPSTPPYSLWQHSIKKELHTETPFSATITNHAHSPVVNSVQISRGVACSSISEHDSTQSCEWIITTEPPESSPSHRIVEKQLLECTSFDAEFRNKCALSIAQHLESEVSKRINNSTINNSEDDITEKTKETAKRSTKPLSPPKENKSNSTRLNDTYENMKRQEVELQVALEQLKCNSHNESNGKSIVQSDSDTSSLIELQHSLIDKQQKEQHLWEQEQQM